MLSTNATKLDMASPALSPSTFTFNETQYHKMLIRPLNDSCCRTPLFNNFIFSFRQWVQQKLLYKNNQKTQNYIISVNCVWVVHLSLSNINQVSGMGLFVPTTYKSENGKLSVIKKKVLVKRLRIVFAAERDGATYKTIKSYSVTASCMSCTSCYFVHAQYSSFCIIYYGL